VDDWIGADIKQYFDQTCNIIQEAIDNNVSCLVVCSAV